MTVAATDIEITDTTSVILYDAQYVPVYVSPAAPTNVTLASASDTGGSDSDAVTSLNNSGGQTLQFEVEGVIAGALVELYADGELIGQTTATAATATIVTDGTTLLADGDHEITVKQTIEGEAVEVGNLSTTADLESGPSAALAVTVDTTAPEITSAPLTTAYEDGTYIYQVSAIDNSDGEISYSLEKSPADMTIEPGTGRIIWTAVVGAGTTEEIIIRATDAAGNSTIRLSIYRSWPRTPRRSSRPASPENRRNRRRDGRHVQPDRPRSSTTATARRSSPTPTTRLSWAESP